MLLAKFEANHIHKQVNKQKQNSANVKVSPQGYLIITKQRFTFNSADVIEMFALWPNG